MKVFGIGLSRTGTKSLADALEKLGFRSKHFPSLKALLWDAERYDALTDTTVALFYKRLDELYPDAKFVLTVRDETSWLDSVERFWAWSRRYRQNRADKKALKSGTITNIVLYGSDVFNADLYVYARHRHHEDVRRYFANRPGKLLELDICGGEGYEKLCPFLGLDVLDKPFPHIHQGKD